MNELGLAISGLFLALAGWLGMNKDVPTVTAGGTVSAPLAGLPSNRRLTPEEVAPVIADYNRRYFGGWFKVADVLAIIQIESSFRPWVYRDEPQIGDRSCGLMQLLRSTAADRGYTGAESGLFEPERNILLGMKHLKWGHDYLASRLGRAPVEREWITAYNAGVGNVLKGFTNDYYNRFTQARNSFGRF